MGQDIIFECRNEIEAKARHKVASTSTHGNRNTQESEKKGQNTNRYHRLKNLDSDLRELSRSYSSCLHHEYMSLKTLGDVSDNEVLKRGSMYQSSKEVRRMRKLREGRKKVDYVGSDDTFLSFEIVDSMPQPGSNEAVLLSHKSRSPLVTYDAVSMPSSGDASQSTAKKPMEFLDLSFRDLPDKNLDYTNLKSDLVPTNNSSVDDHLEICLHTADSKSHHTKGAPDILELRSLKESKSERNRKVRHVKPSSERDPLNILPKSFSAKAGMSTASFQAQCNLVDASPKPRFSPFKKMLDPIMKSKSLKNSSLVQTEHENTAIDPASIRRNAVSPKSLLSDFSTTTEKIESDKHLIGVEETASSPVHLHGTLKLENGNGNPSFEFSIRDPEDVLSAKTWKTDNAYTWVYTFHSSKKKNNPGKGAKDKHGQSSPIVGQMQVSCYLCSEMRENGSLANSTVAEFVLYDIVQARRSFAIEERSQCSTDSIQSLTGNVTDSVIPDASLERNNSMECRTPARCAVSSCESDTSTSYPWSAADLHPHLETAAVVIQIPFNKKEKLKDQKEVSLKDDQNLSSNSVDMGSQSCYKDRSPAIVKVVTPSGTHGMPDADEGGPSTLLDRWRFGGGCDCGGWDMGCPIVVFDNPLADNMDKTLESRKPIVLYLQGSKEKVPALSVMADGKGQYSVDFHAHFSALQAFSICIAILHSSESSSAAVHEKSRQRFFSDSLKLLLEEEVRQLIEAVAVEKKRKEEKRVEKIPPSFFLDPPFSPIGRV